MASLSDVLSVHRTVTGSGSSRRRWP